MNQHSYFRIENTNNSLAAGSTAIIYRPAQHPLNPACNDFGTASFALSKAIHHWKPNARELMRKKAGNAKKALLENKNRLKGAVAENRRPNNRRNPIYIPDVLDEVRAPII